ncbi:MAG: hypothetical protein HY914_10120 [Desulfomonile tiedjei]|nr:hypothetical protein [Desulfomonile tiedjei]
MVELRDNLPIDKIVAELRAGAGDVPIMEKYGIDPGELLQIKKDVEGLQGFATPLLTSARLIPETERRVLPRREPLYRITVFDATNPQINGILGDIHTKGLQVEGITVMTGEARTLTITAEPYNVHTTLTFEAECRWSMINDYGLCVAGFLITTITPKDARELRKLIDSLTVPVGRR